MATDLTPFIEIINEVAREVAREPQKVVYRVRFVDEVLIEFGDRRLTLDGDTITLCNRRFDREAGLAAFRELVKAHLEDLFDPDPVTPPGMAGRG